MPTAPSSTVVGYEARACGFDLDADGFRGESEDCQVCDGSTTDVNSDGIVDRLAYVDCDRGVANADGSPNGPYATIGQALASLASPDAEAI